MMIAPRVCSDTTLFERLLHVKKPTWSDLSTGLASIVSRRGSAHLGEFAWLRRPAPRRGIRLLI
jgi:hypothetical protein